MLSSLPTCSAIAYLFMLFERTAFNTRGVASQRTACLLVPRSSPRCWAARQCQCQPWRAWRQPLGLYSPARLSEPRKALPWPCCRQADSPGAEGEGTEAGQLQVGHAAGRGGAGPFLSGPHREREGGSASRRRSPRSGGFAAGLDRTGTGYAAGAGRGRAAAVRLRAAAVPGRRAEGESGLTAARPRPPGDGPGRVPRAPGARPAARVTNAQRHGQARSHRRARARLKRRPVDATWGRGRGCWCRGQALYWPTLLLCSAWAALLPWVAVASHVGVETSAEEAVLDRPESTPGASP